MKNREAYKHTTQVYSSSSSILDCPFNLLIASAMLNFNVLESRSLIPRQEARMLSTMLSMVSCGSFVPDESVVSFGILYLVCLSNMPKVSMRMLMRLNTAILACFLSRLCAFFTEIYFTTPFQEMGTLVFEFFRDCVNGLQQDFNFFVGFACHQTII